MIKSTLALLLATAYIPAVFATDRSHESTVAFVYPQGDGSFAVGFTQNDPYCTNAETPIKLYWVIVGQNSVTADGLRNMLAAAYAALVSEIPINFGFSDSSSNCYIKNMKLKR